jgi:hypothetical protein
VFGTGAKIVQKEGVMALWKGLLPPVVASTPMYALCFFGYGVGKNLFCDDDAFEEGNFKLGQIGMAGAFSAVFTTPVMAPQERLKCVLQTQKPGPDGKLPSMSHVASSLYKEGGLMNLLRGSGVTVLRDSSASFMYFTTYEIMKYKMRQYSSNGELHLGHFIIAGGVAGIMNWVRVCVCVCVCQSNMSVCVNQTCHALILYFHHSPTHLHTGTRNSIRCTQDKLPDCTDRKIHWMFSGCSSRLQNAHCRRWNQSALQRHSTDFHSCFSRKCCMFQWI